jgi:hypothetical protein
MGDLLGASSRRACGTFGNADFTASWTAASGTLGIYWRMLDGRMHLHGAMGH